MESIIGKHDVTYSGQTLGTLSISAEGAYYIFDFAGEIPGGEVCRLVCRSENKYIPIGIPIPENGRLRLKKSFTRSTLIALGIACGESYSLLPLDAPLYVEVSQKNEEPPSVPAADLSEEPLMPALPLLSEAVLPQAEPEPDELQDDLSFFESSCADWHDEYEPWKLFSDEALCSACITLRGALRKTVDDCDYLAVPVSPSEPFPMMPVFCFGTSELINGRQYVVFTAKNGELI